MRQRYFVYIITNRKNGVLYTGHTSDLSKRIPQHIQQSDPHAFSARYNLKKLVYYEEHRTSYSAFKRERQIKKWNRAWKIELIEKENPDWKDLAIDLLKD
jgi:putative endonuclease